MVRLALTRVGGACKEVVQPCTFRAYKQYNAKDTDFLIQLHNMAHPSKEHGTHFLIWYSVSHMHACDYKSGRLVPTVSTLVQQMPILFAEATERVLMLA